MTKIERNNLINEKCIAYYSGFGGVEIKAIGNLRNTPKQGLEERVYFVSGAWYSAKEAHSAKIHFETERPYFLYMGNRIHLDECLRA